MEDRLSGARAAEAARKIMEQMVLEGYEIASNTANFCIMNSIGAGPNGTHDGHGGIDTALSMIAAIELSEVPPVIQMNTYAKLITAMVDEGSIDEALAILRSLVVTGDSPPLQVFADIAMEAVRGGSKDAEKVLTVLAYAKAAGYEIDNIASTADGRALLAAGVIAAQLLDNLGLGLRLLTAASKAQGCSPDRGDALVASSSSAAQRASTIIHRLAINKAVEANSWKLCVRLLELMIERSLTPSPGVWRNVVTCCAKAEKSRKATALLFDWVSSCRRMGVMLRCFDLTSFAG
jgi:hypothetical protein